MQPNLEQPTADETARHDSSEDRKEVKSGILIDSLALLPEQAILDESKLAQSLQVSNRTVRRMVSRLELPPPIPLGGRSVWMVGRILRHLENACELVEREAAKELKRIQRFSP